MLRAQTAYPTSVQKRKSRTGNRPRCRASDAQRSTFDAVQENREFKDGKDRELDRKKIKVQFKELFLEKYFPIVSGMSKEAEFLHLTQGNLSLVEYSQSLTELFATPHPVDTKSAKQDASRKD
ncbi:hypothetical protein FNV43_RR18696 [Rhamnella rubrinervis]|uniref:Retrotransposon gag domain-containing protein n=1 Tax=Rhamnella rubrinervis TaxID=2594499 RepID=A0A8K0GT63_9ROSA|nr:hypothetical protein FNV43_RR18696 [Rhamnella rubrinervis]